MTSIRRIVAGSAPAAADGRGPDRAARLCRGRPGAGHLLHARHGGAALHGHRQQPGLHRLRRAGRSGPGAAAAPAAVAGQCAAARRRGAARRSGRGHERPAPVDAEPGLHAASTRLRPFALAL